ncbi:hypothetical protein IWX78_001333 [Mycetocola sp. CAN_C7]
MTKSPLIRDSQHIQQIYPEFLTETDSKESLGKRVERVVTDESGHRWPTTGYICDTCRMPLHASQAVYGTHPLCDIGATA